MISWSRDPLAHVHTDAFRWITVVLSMILGLGTTRLLSALVAMFRSRSHAQLDWVPLLWAACIFLWQLQFWWAIIELQGVARTWTAVDFLMLVSLTLVLFVAAALVIPPGELHPDERLQTSFEKDGRWSLVALSVYFLAAMLADRILWKLALFSYPAALLILLASLPLVSFWASSRRVQCIVVVAYLLLSCWSASVMSPNAYS